MPMSHLLRAIFARVARALALTLLAQCASFAFAASIRGVVTDATGAKVTGASIALMSNGKVIASSVSASDGSFELSTGTSGRYFLVVSASSFRQLQTPDFYAGQFDSIEHNLVLEPAWVRESIVVTATGTPTPQPQTSASTDVLGPLDLATRDDLTSVLRLMPGTSVVQSGQLGSQTSLFVRGGDSDGNKVVLDGVDVGDLGNQFNFGSFSATAVESAEVYRGPDSDLFGAGAESGVVSLTTPHGTTSFPSLLFQGEAGTFYTSREQLELAGAHKKLDYLGAFSWLQTNNDLPDDEFHVATAAANLGYALNGTTQVRGTAHYGVAATGVPNSWDFYHVADDVTQKDQDIYVSGAIDNQTTAAFHQSAAYGLTRKREETNQWEPSGVLLNNYDGFGDSGYFGLPVTIVGANGYSATGQALLDSTTTNDYLIVNNRDQVVYQGDFQFTHHLAGLIGFRFENERGVEVYNSYWNGVNTFAIDDTDARTNYVYLAGVQGDFKNRFYYHLAGSLERYSLFGTQTSPNAGLSYYVLRPRSGVFSGTRAFGSFGDAVREPKLTDKFGSLYEILSNAGETSAIQAFHITPLAAPTARTYEAGGEQTFLSQHLIFRASYFHNEFGKDLEPVSTSYLSLLFPDYTAAQIQQLSTFFNNNSVFDLIANTQDYRAQGIESTVEGGIGKYLFLRGGYTYLDAVVQHSFSSDNEDLLNGFGFSYNGVPLGSVSPLVGARPFRRAPHTGFISATFASKKISGVFSAAFASRSDDSTYLPYSDENGGNSLLLPNRNLDYGYAKLDLGGSYQLFSWMDIYAQADNLVNSQHIAPIGYPSLPFNIHAGLRLRWGPGSGH
jgi:vitamin B12 transporter